MTTLTTPTQPVERDRWGRPKIKAPDGKLKPYTRATTVAGTLDDRHNLEKWLQRQAVIGLAKRPDLYALATQSDPTDRKALGRHRDRSGRRRSIRRPSQPRHRPPRPHRSV